jgi:small-conductance mechanosensitive channel
MIQAFQSILQNTFDRLYTHANHYLPSILAALVILLVTWLVALSVRWVLLRAMKATVIDNFLSDTGLASMLGRVGRTPGARLVASAVYCTIVVLGWLIALDVFNTRLTTQIIEGTVFLFPKLVTAGVILLAGFWLARYLGRSMLVWACNEELPHPRRWASAVRVCVSFISIVVAAQTLNFAPSVFLAAFVILAGGAALAGSLAIGLGSREPVRNYLTQKKHPEEEEEKAIWSHL